MGPSLGWAPWTGAAQTGENIPAKFAESTFDTVRRITATVPGLG